MNAFFRTTAVEKGELLGSGGRLGDEAFAP